MAESKSMLEPDFEPDFAAWKATPNPHQTTLLLGRLQPTIDKAISAHVGNSDPIIRSRAKQLTLQAVKTYDPMKAKLSTHLFNQLQGLKRIYRKQNQIISVPERISLGQGQLLSADAELQERLGRDPTSGEIADYTGLSLRRIKQIRTAPSNAMPEGYYDGLDTEEGGGGFSSAADGTGGVRAEGTGAAAGFRRAIGERRQGRKILHSRARRRRVALRTGQRKSEADHLAPRLCWVEVGRFENARFRVRRHGTAVDYGEPAGGGQAGGVERMRDLPHDGLRC